MYIYLDYILQKLKYTPAVRSNILSKLIFASCVWYSDRAYYGLCVLIKDIGRRLPLQLQCSYQGQQGDVRQSLRAETIKPVSEGDKIWQLWKEIYILGPPTQHTPQYIMAGIDQYF